MSYGTSVGGTNSTISFSSGSWSSTYELELSSLTSTVATWDLAYQSSSLLEPSYGIQIHSGNVLKVEGTGQSGADPTQYNIIRGGSSTTYTNDTGVIQANDVIELEDSSSVTKGVFTVLADHLWSSGGGGGGFLGNNPLIENAYFVKNSDSSIALGFDWENISSYKVWVNRGGTITSSELFLTGSSGTITGYIGAGVNALTNLSEGDTVWLTDGNDDSSIVEGSGSYVHKVVVWSKDDEKVYAKCFGDVTFSGGQSSTGTKATRLRGGKSYGSYVSPTTNEITHELPRGLGKYQIELWTVNNSGNPISFVDYGTFFHDSSQVSQNFW